MYAIAKEEFLRGSSLPFSRGGLVNPHVRASNEGSLHVLATARCASTAGLTCLPRLFLLRHQHLLPLLEDPVNRLGGAGIQAEPAALQTAGGVELVRRRRQPGAGGTNGDADRLVGAAIGMSDEVITDDHHGFDSFEETLREDLEHVLGTLFRHFHSFTRALMRSLSSGICSRLFSIAPMILSMRAARVASRSLVARRS